MQAIRTLSILGLVLLVGTWPIRLWAQHDIRLEHFTVEDGLPENSAFAIVQDHLGFMWFGTQNGLVKYDGYTFTIYKPDPDDPFSISGSSIKALYEDEQGDLWIGTYQGGLNRLDRKTERFTHYRHDPSDPNTLSEGRILSIHIDRGGALWLFIREGDGNAGAGVVDRFDPDTGTVTHFASQLGSPDPGVVVPLEKDMGIYEDRSGVIWVGIDGGGLNRFDASTETFTRYLHQASDPRSLSSNRVENIIEDRQGQLWVGTSGGGLNRFDASTETFTRYRHQASDPRSLSSNHTAHLFEDRQGQLWIGTYSIGLNRFDASTDSFTRYLHDRNAPNAITQPGRVFESSEGVLWFLASDGALFRYDREADVFLPNVYSPDDPSSLIGKWIVAIYADSMGAIWLGTHGVDIHRLDRTTSKFPYYRFLPNTPNSLNDSRVTAIHEGRDGVLWLGTVGGGLNRFDRKTGVFSHYEHDPNDPRSVSHNEITFVHEDRTGTVWVGTMRGGLNRFDQATGTFTRYRHDRQKATSLSDDRVRYILEDRAGALWVATETGVNKLDRATGTFARYQLDASVPKSDSYNRVFCLYEDRAGTFWVGTEGGVISLDRSTGLFTTNLSPRDQISTTTSIYEDHAGRLWVGTYGRGLHLLGQETGISTPFFTEKDGLLNDRVRGIVEDEEGRLWISTQNGISRFDPHTKAVRNYDVLDGLPSNNFYPRAVFKSADGELFFGSDQGFTAFYPDQIKDNPYPPQMALTDFKLMGRPVSISEDAPLKTRISVADAITLAHDQNDFSFSFTALHYSRPEKNRYAYIMENYDEEWRAVGTERTATYMNLPSGKYVFRVKGSNQDGIWNEEGVAIRITIQPPWWKTPWAYVGYLLFFLLGVVAVDRIQRARVIRKEREKAQIREAELRAESAELQADAVAAQARALRAENERKEVELERARELEEAYRHLKATQAQLVQAEKLASLGQLTAGIAHEIKNPLNFVNNFAEFNVEVADELLEKIDDAPETLLADIEEDLRDIKTTAQKINEHGKRADGIVKSMLLHSRGAPGQRELVNINTLLDEYINLAYHSMRANEPAFTVTIERYLDETVRPVEMVPQEMGRVFLNTLNNAFYAIHKKKQAHPEDYAPAILVRTRNVDDEVEIRIWDNGGGIPKKMREKIFEPFFTTKPPGMGTGLGLSLSYDIVVQGHQGSMTVESEEGTYTAFMIKLPIS